MNFEWDDKKNEINIQKHGFQLSEGALVFEDINHIDVLDEKYDYGEERILTIGLCIRNLLCVCWTERHNDTIRIISVRAATKKEQRIYNGDN